MAEICIIDDGIVPQKYTHIKSVHRFRVRNGAFGPDDRQYVPTSHGSICAMILDKYLDYKVDLISINIMEACEKGNIENLLVALRWCFFHRLKFISLSCGTTDKSDRIPLAKILRHNAASMIFAAESNRNIKTYPASFSSVIGVRCNPQFFHNRFRFLENDENGIEIEAAGIHQLMIGSTRILTPPCSSYATPMICAKFSSIALKKELYQKESLIKHLYNEV